MTIGPTQLYFIPLGAVIAGWVCFILIMVLRKRSASSQVQKKEPAAIIGIVMQVVGFMVIGSWRRKFITPIIPMSNSLWLAVDIFNIALVPFFLFLMWWSIRTLGKQWSIQARVLEGHSLITTGPYRFVRNPIYVALTSVGVSIGLAYSHWCAFIIGVVLAIVGAIIRVKSEEKLLREQFGEEYEAYARRVPALLPGMRMGS